MTQNGSNKDINMDERRKWPKVSVIIPIHNGVKYTLECLDSLRRIDYSNFEVIVVDDGSTDGSFQSISSNYPDVKVLVGDGHLWWTGAVNMGIRDALQRDPEYILLLNNDNVVERSSFNELVKCALENPRSIVGSKVCFLNNPAKIRHAGGAIDWSTGRLVDLHHGDLDVGQFRGIEQVDWLGGMGVLVPSQAFAEVGFFDDENFPQYMGDIDYWLRASKAGYRILVNPMSVVWDNPEHSRTRALGRRLSPRYIFKSLFSIGSHVNIRVQYKFFRKHCPSKDFPRSLLLFYAGCFLYWLDRK